MNTIDDLDQQDRDPHPNLVHEPAHRLHEQPAGGQRAARLRRRSLRLRRAQHPRRTQGAQHRRVHDQREPDRPDHDHLEPHPGRGNPARHDPSQRPLPRPDHRGTPHDPRLAPGHRLTPSHRGYPPNQGPFPCPSPLKDSSKIVG
nr:MAG TPA: hypothetical protein [Caudoviricetes sp.]